MVAESQAGWNIRFEPQEFVDAVQSLWTRADCFLDYRAAAIQYARGRGWEQMGFLMAQVIAQVTGVTDYMGTVVPVVDEKGGACYN